jgi:hypothetical protein
MIRLQKLLKRVMLFLIKITSRYLSDEVFLRMYYYVHMNKYLDLKCPMTFNEKLNWLKLYDRRPIYTKLVDKYEVKSYVSSIIGEDKVIPTYAVWDSPEEIDWSILPKQFVLKTTHGGGNCGVIICKDKNVFDINLAYNKLKKALKQDLYKSSREWPYRDVKRRIIVEPYIEDKQTSELRDYKFFCFDGDVKFLFIASERQTRPEPYFDFFDAEFNPLPIKQGHPNSENKPSKPKCFEEMKIIASKLSKGFPHVRVDLYEVNGSVLFGELTFYHFGGVVPFEPEAWDYKLGEYIQLPKAINE